MTISPPSKSKKIEIHPLKVNSFIGEPRHVSLMPISANAHHVMALICSEWGYDGKIEFTIDRISDFLKRSYTTARRTIKELVEAGLIQTIRTGKSLRFYLTDLVYNPRKVKRKKPKPKPKPKNNFDNQKKKGRTDEQKKESSKNYGKNENEISNNSYMFGRRVFTGGHSPKFYLYNNKKRIQQTLSKFDQSDNLKPDEPSAVFFSKKTAKKLGNYTKSISECCAKMINMHGFIDKYNPIKLIKWGLKNGFHPGAIDESLKAITKFSSLEKVHPYKILRHISKIKSQNYNEQDSIAEHEKRKRLDREFLKNGGFNALIGKQ